MLCDVLGETYTPRVHTRRSRRAHPSVNFRGRCSCAEPEPRAPGAALGGQAGELGAAAPRLPSYLLGTLSFLSQISQQIVQ